MRLADAIGLRIGGKDAIEARLNGQVVWSAQSDPADEMVALLFGAGQAGPFHDFRPENLYVDEERTTHPVPGDPVWWAMDVSGNGMHAGALASADRPTYGTDGIHHWLYFNGTQKLAMPFAYLSNQTAMTRFVAHRADSTSSTGYALGAGAGTSTTILGGFRVSSDFQYRARRVEADTQLQIDIPNFMKNNVSVFRANYDTGVVYARNNGGQTANQTLGSTGTLGNHTFSWIGSLGGAGQFGYIGRIYGVIDVADTVSPENIRTVEAYLQELMA